MYPSGLQRPSQGVARSPSSLTPDTMEDAIILPLDSLQLSARLETAGCDFTPHPHTVALILAQRLAHANHFADNSSWGETLQSSPTSLRRRVEMLVCAQIPTFSRSDFRPLFEQIVNAWPTVSNYQGDESRSIRQSVLPLAWRCERIAEFTCHSRRRKTHSSD